MGLRTAIRPPSVPLTEIWGSHTSLHEAAFPRRRLTMGVHPAPTAWTWMGPRVSTMPGCRQGRRHGDEEAE